MAEKIDLKKTENAYFTAPRDDFALQMVQGYSYLMIDGRGSPGDSAEYQNALKALYPLAYATKFFSKQELGHDYIVPPLEALWWADDMAAYVEPYRRDEWRWTLMLMLPGWIVESHVEQARLKKPDLDLSNVRLNHLEEGLCLSKLHLGPFADEAAVLRRLHHEFIPSVAMRSTAGTMKSTCRIPVAPPRKSCAQSFGSRFESAKILAAPEGALRERWGSGSRRQRAPRGRSSQIVRLVDHSGRALRKGLYWTGSWRGPQPKGSPYVSALLAAGHFWFACPRFKTDRPPDVHQRSTSATR